MAGHAAQDEQVRQHVDDVDRLELAVDPDRQAFAGELVDDVEHAELAAVMGAVLDEVVGPDMVGMLRPQPDARAVVQPQPAPLGLLLAGPSAPPAARSARPACRSPASRHARSIAVIRR